MAQQEITDGRYSFMLLSPTFFTSLDGQGADCGAVWDRSLARDTRAFEAAATADDEKRGGVRTYCYDGLK